MFSLIEQGKSEYIEKGAKKTTALSLAAKYLKLSNSMEKQSDAEFNTLINAFKTELTNNSYETDIVNEVKNYYNNYKKSLRGQLLQKATQHL